MRCRLRICQILKAWGRGRFKGGEGLVTLHLGRALYFFDRDSKGLAIFYV